MEATTSDNSDDDPVSIGSKPNIFKFLNNIDDIVMIIVTVVKKCKRTVRSQRNPV